MPRFERADMLTTPYVFNATDAEAMAKAGADIVVCHLGLTTGGAIGAQTALKLEDCPGRIDSWAAAALAVNPEILVLALGGPVAEPADAAFILKHTRTQVSRLLRRLLDGAASGGAGADGTGSKIQGDRRELNAG
jgi:predicted TIM-barrel enzyme